MAKKLKLIEMGRDLWEKRWHASVESLNRLGFLLEIQQVIASNENFEEKFQESLNQKPDVLIVGPEFSNISLLLSPLQTKEAEHLGGALAYIKNGEKLWPRRFLDEAVLRAVSRYSKQLDLMAPALVAGGGGVVPFVVSALCKIGFNKISITDVENERGVSFVESLKGKFFNVDLNFIFFESITTLPGIYSFLINTTDLSLDNYLLDELYFFNFLKSNAVVADMTFPPSETPLLSEAKAWGARLLSGDKICSELDILLWEHVCGAKISEADYEKSLRNVAAENTFDSSPYLKRFLERI